MPQSKARRLVAIAQSIAGAAGDFQAVRGPGAGDHHTADFMRKLREEVAKHIDPACAELPICGDTDFKADFYFRDEATIVEVALGLPNPSTEFEKDILKAILAKDLSHPVTRLVFVSRAGGAKKCSQPGRMSVRRLIEAKHGIAIEVHDLPGEPRRRKRRLNGRGDR